MIAARSRWRAGFAHFRFRPVYNIQIPRAQEILGVDRKVHTAEHVASAMFFLGVPRADIPRARLLPGPLGRVLARTPSWVSHGFGARQTWPSFNFLAVAEHLERHLGMEPVFIAGPGESLDDIRPRYRCPASASGRNKIAARRRFALCWKRQRTRAHGGRIRTARGSLVRIIRSRYLAPVADWSRRCSRIRPASIRSGSSTPVEAIETVLAPQPQ